jgi:hypothetical protein
MKFEIAKQLAESGQLNNEHKQKINRIIMLLRKHKDKELRIKSRIIRRYDNRIEKWKRIIEL